MAKWLSDSVTLSLWTICTVFYSEGIVGFLQSIFLPIEEKIIKLCVLRASSERSERVVKYIQSPTRIAKPGPSAQLKDYENI